MILNMMLSVGNFILGGFSTLREASRGEYSTKSTDVERMREELMNSDLTWRGDKKNLVNDSKNVASDWRKSYNRLVEIDG